jgi:CBS domain-containing protein
MSRPVVTIEGTASLWDAVERFFPSGLRHPIVVTDGRCLGVIADRHVAAEWPLHRLELRTRLVREILEDCQPDTVPDAPMVDAAWVMLGNRVDALPVVDEEHRIVGVLTGSDLIRALVAIAEEPEPAHTSA